MLDYLHKGPFDTYTLYECRGAYLLRSHRLGCLHRVLWHMESGWGIYIRPEGNITGLHYFEDEVTHVARLPAE